MKNTDPTLFSLSFFALLQNCKDWIKHLLRQASNVLFVGVAALCAKVKRLSAVE